MGTPFMSELRIMAFNYAPQGWALCNGQLLQINQNQALFALLGTTYGGDGRDEFALPNLQGRVPLHFGAGIGLGTAGGAASHTLATSELPAHTHQLMGDAATPAGSNFKDPGATGTRVLGQSVGEQTPTGSFTVQMYGTGAPNGNLHATALGASGGSQPHPNQQPYTVLNICIAVQGIFPSPT